MLLRHATTNEVDGTDRESCSVENISISIVEHLCSITRHIILQVLSNKLFSELQN